MKKKLALLLGSLLFVLVLTVIADRLYGAIAGPFHELVSTPGSSAAYKTPEYEFVARFNNLGFRDRDFELEKETTYRILALGDSFTWGWGVAVEMSWPKVLEKRLREQGLAVEVANLGQAGASPARYAEIARSAIPLLQPDLVLVGVLQGDDIRQLMASSKNPARTPIDPPPQGVLPGLRDLIDRVRARLFPNFSVAYRRIVGQEVDISALWRDYVRHYLSQLSEERAARFELLDEELKRMFLAAEINPGLLALSLDPSDQPQRLRDDVDPHVREAIREMGEQLRSIREHAEAAGGDVIVLSIPSALYVSPASLETYKRMGGQPREDALVTTSMDDDIRAAATIAGLPLVAVTSAFRAEAARRPLFLLYDGHLNEEGYLFLARMIEDEIGAALKGAE